MKRIIATVSIMIMVFVGTAMAAEVSSSDGGKVRLGISVDFAYVDMDDVQKNFKLDNVSNNLSSGILDLEHALAHNLSSGIAAMVDLDVSVAPFLMFGARTGYLFCQPAVTEYDFLVYQQTTTLNASLVPLEIGLIFNAESPASPLSLQLGLYGGYGIGFASVKNDMVLLGQTAEYTRPFVGGGIMGEAVTTLKLKVLPFFGLTLNAGYRMAKIKQMKQTRAVNYEGIAGLSIPVGEKGDVFKGTDNKDLEFDFSGFNVGVGIALGF